MINLYFVFNNVFRNIVKRLIKRPNDDSGLVLLAKRLIKWAITEKPSQNVLIFSIIMPGNGTGNFSKLTTV